MDFPNFWDQTHPLSSQAEKLFEDLVPSSGNCTTLQGELLRASSKIGYDWFNNGWGCNNWSGAVNFLREHIADLPNAVEEEGASARFHAALNEAYHFSHGEPVTVSDDRADRLVTDIHSYVVQKIIANPESIANDQDMWDFSEPDYIPDDEDDDWFGGDEDDEEDF